VGTLALLVLVRAAISLSALAHADLPGLPRIRGHALSGDATGFYAAAREFIAAWARVPRPLLALLALATLVVAVVLVRAWRRRPELRAWLLVAAAWWLGVLLVVDVLEQQFSGSAVIGWSIVWALPMLPVRAVGATLDQNVAFWLGLPLQLACNAVTVVATAYVGLHATGRRAVGLIAAALFAIWPFLTGAIAGHSAWENATWTVDAGLHMYTEPLSTALVAVGLALLLAPRLTPIRLAVAGILLGYAAAVKLSNALVVVAGAILLAWRYRERLGQVAPYLAGALAWMPLVAAYWPLGYAKLRHDPTYWHGNAFSTSYVVTSWTKSFLFTPHTLAIIVPLALLGAFAIHDRWRLAMLVSWTLANPVLYSFFWYTKLHPRFMWASLPSFFVLWASGLVLIAAGLVNLARSGRRPAPRPLRGRRAT
jgi:hypothetical protein